MQGCGGCNPLDGSYIYNGYVLKCTEIIPLQELAITYVLYIVLFLCNTSIS